MRWTIWAPCIGYTAWKYVVFSARLWVARMQYMDLSFLFLCTCPVPCVYYQVPGSEQCVVIEWSWEYLIQWYKVTTKIHGKSGIKNYISFGVENFWSLCITFSWYSFSVNFVKTARRLHNGSQGCLPAKGYWPTFPLSVCKIFVVLSVFSLSQRMFVSFVWTEC